MADYHVCFVEGLSRVYGIPVPEVRASRGKQVYRYEPSSSTLITRSPMLRDPYEHRYVYVKESTLPMAGEGLYAKTKIKKVNNNLSLAIRNLCQPL
jgi:hypothetical protein